MKEILEQKGSPVVLKESRWKDMATLFNELGFKRGAEIGVAKGDFTITLCRNMPGLELFAIDAWQTYDGYRDYRDQQQLEDYHDKVVERMAPFNCTIIRKWSMDAVDCFEDESLDFVFIDGNHDFKNVADDIVEWSKKVRKGGIVAGHDFYDQDHGIKFGVKYVVRAWMEYNKIENWFIMHGDKCPSWFYVK